MSQESIKETGNAADGKKQKTLEKANPSTKVTIKSKLYLHNSVLVNEHQKDKNNKASASRKWSAVFFRASLSLQRIRVHMASQPSSKRSEWDLCRLVTQATADAETRFIHLKDYNTIFFILALALSSLLMHFRNRTVIAHLHCRSSALTLAADAKTPWY